MPVYSVIRKADAVEVSRYAAQAVVEGEWPLATFDHVELDDEGQPTQYLGSWRISKLAFRNRFTSTEKVAIELGALDNPAATIEQRSLAATLRANQLDVAAAQFIDLKRADTRAGVQALEAYGLIGTGRAAVILDTVPSETELWNG